MNVEVKNSQQYQFPFPMSPSGYWSASCAVRDEFGIVKRFNEDDISHSFERFNSYASALQDAGWLDYFEFLNLDVDAGNEWAEGDEWVSLVARGRIEAGQEISLKKQLIVNQIFAPPLSSERFTFLKFNKQSGKIVLPKNSTISPFLGYLFRFLNVEDVSYGDLIQGCEDSANRFLNSERVASREQILEFLDLTMLISVDNEFSDYCKAFFMADVDQLSVELYRAGFTPKFLHALYMLDALVENKSQAAYYLTLWNQMPFSWFVKYISSESV